MTYSPTSPQGVPSPLAQAAQVRTNFAQFAALFSHTIGAAIYNHMALNDPKQGDHASVIFQNRSGDPTITTNLDVLYSKDATSKAGTQAQLFLRIPNFLPTFQDPSTPGNDPMQLTYNAVDLTGPDYQSFLAGGYLIYFGSFTGNTVPGSGINVTRILSPAPTILLLAIAVPNTMTSVGTPVPFTVSTVINTVTNDRFDVNSTANGSGGIIPYSFKWIAIGTV